jgi:hypothetical protein
MCPERTSAVFTQEYGEKAADIFGRLNEMNPFGDSGPDAQKAKNIDLRQLNLLLR